MQDSLSNCIITKGRQNKSGHQYVNLTFQNISFINPRSATKSVIVAYTGFPRVGDVNLLLWPIKNLARVQGTSWTVKNYFKFEKVPCRHLFKLVNKTIPILFRFRLPKRGNREHETQILKKYGFKTSLSMVCVYAPHCNCIYCFHNKRKMSLHFLHD